MALMSEDDKPWKTDLARKSAQRRENVLQEVEETIKKAPSFEEADDLGGVGHVGAPGRGRRERAPVTLGQLDPELPLER